MKKQRIKLRKKEVLLAYLIILDNKSRVKDKQKTPRKRNNLRNGGKFKSKEEPPYTQAQLLSKRKKILSKMPLYEALYRGVTGNTKKSSPSSVEKPKSQTVNRLKVRIK